MFVSKRGDTTEHSRSENEPSGKELNDTPDQFLPPADTNELESEIYSVTDEPTKHLNLPR